MPIHVWGTDFHRSDAELRRHLFIPEAERRARVRKILSLGFGDFVYLHTCNRVEFYTTAKSHFYDTRPLWYALFRHLGLSESSFFKGYYLEGKSAVRHLVRVASSLESLVIGEAQILGQLKAALGWTLDNDLPVSSGMHRAFQLAFQTAKQVRTETGIGSKSVSVATLGIERAERLAAEYPLRSVVLVGRSPITRVVLDWLVRLPEPPLIYWVNRNKEALLQYEDAGRATLLSLEEFLEDPVPFTHLFTATASQDPIFGYEFLDRIPNPRCLLFDFAEPPDICADCLPAGMTFVTLDSLTTEAEHNRQLRLQAIEKADPIIEGSLQRFYLEQKETPLLRDFSSVEPNILDEMETFLHRIQAFVSEENQEKLRRWTRALVKRNLHISREHLRRLLREAVDSESQPNAM